jgi:PAS domain S-box-containing protein
MRAWSPGVRPLLLTSALALAGGAQLVHMTAHELTAQVSFAADLAVLGGIIGAGLLGAVLLGDARRADNALHRNEARYRAIVDGAGEAIIVIDDQAEIVSFNHAAEQVFGYTAEEMIGTSLERLMPDHVRRAHAQHLAMHGVTGMVEAVRRRSVHKGLRRTGEVFPFELTMAEWADGGRRMFTASCATSPSVNAPRPRFGKARPATPASTKTAPNPSSSTPSARRHRSGLTP